MKYISPLNRRHNLFSGTSFGDLQAELDALFGAFVPASGLSSRRNNTGIAWYESEDGYTARIDLPGVKPSDVSLDVKDGEVALKAKRVYKGSGAENERTVKIAKTVAVPEGSDETKIGASHADGVLSIEFPKAEAAEPRKIDVQFNN